jgi:hypothetical protein
LYQTVLIVTQEDAFLLQKLIKGISRKTTPSACGHNPKLSFIRGYSRDCLCCRQPAPHKGKAAQEQGFVWKVGWWEGVLRTASGSSDIYMSMPEASCWTPPTRHVARPRVLFSLAQEP